MDTRLERREASVVHRRSGQCRGWIKWRWHVSVVDDDGARAHPSSPQRHRLHSPLGPSYPLHICHFSTSRLLSWSALQHSLVIDLNGGRPWMLQAERRRQLSLSEKALGPHLSAVRMIRSTQKDVVFSAPPMLTRQRETVCVCLGG